VAADPAVLVEGSMDIADGQWHVDVLRRGDQRWCRIPHGATTEDDCPLPTRSTC
jgi:hypothetical protein